MSKNSQKKRVAKPVKGIAMGHLFPVYPTSTKPEGMLVCVSPEEGDPLSLQLLDRVVFDLPKPLRERLAPGVYWLAEERLDVEKIQDAMAEVLEEDGWDEITFCDDCQIADGGKGCGIFNVEAHGFAPRPPPPATLDDDAVADMASMLLEADENGLAFELVQAAFARFCALKPRAAEKLEITMPLQEAEEVIGVELPCETPVIDKAFRAAVSKAHTDAGGSDEAMKRVLAAKRRLDAEIEATS